jgi:ATP-dependent Clp protease protease subunit
MNTIILEEIENGELIPIDVYTKLSGSRILFLTEDIDDKLASDVVATLFLKDIEDPGEKITLFINSEGGDIRNVLMIYDMINIIQSPVETVCIGSCLDEVSIILASGAKRLATKNAIIAINQLSFEFSTISDLTEAETILNQKVADNKTMINILSKKTGKTVAQITKDFSHQVFFTAESALKYGLIDGIISTSRK